ncbi:LysR family transcriptional regulator [Sinorhizobium mexicanum]|uniref:LysR family transcriptional regulator n=1 Tax=Sinorhizobium mexicanum TaxID=375549 RepID=A0A859QFG2_9HYPH|nr:LysR family transcriptional regulator [Sinorhizobium mexicanum]MBP1887408.1 DNA-binding transcriptional LysR family regulator [Sinorhizobium mexicanum]QLL62304.1 LysR family transcriptional regulator [Sinorhizobium mexicanum]
MNQLLAMRAFVRVVESGSFRGAANQLLVPRSTVSKLVTDLEKHLGTRLMHRTTRSVVVTPEGEEYYRYAARLVAEVDEADSAVRGKKVTPRGHLRIESHPTFAQNVLIPHLPDFHRQYPQISIALGIGNRTANIIGEGVDCAIRAGDIGDESLVARHLFDAEFATCASPAYLERMGLPASPEDLDDKHVKVGFFSHADGRMKPLVFTKPDRRYVVSDLQFSANEDNGQIAMMLAGMGIGQNLRPFLLPYLQSGQLVEVLGEWSHPPLPFHVVYASGRHQSARLKVFIQWLVERFGKTNRPRVSSGARLNA